MNFLKKSLRLAISLILLTSQAVLASEALETLDALVKTWTDLRQEISTEEREWQNQQRFLEKEKALLSKEIEDLETESASFEQRSSLLEQQNRDALARKQELSSFFQSLEPLLDEMEAFVLSRRDSLPPPLRDQVMIEKRTRIVDRIQAVTSALLSLEQLQNGIHVVREILLDDQGERREMEVMYLGLSRGFAVSSDQSWAGVASPDANEWMWISRPELRAEITSALRILKQEQAADFVNLPLQLGASTGVNP